MDNPHLHFIPFVYTGPVIYRDSVKFSPLSLQPKCYIVEAVFKHVGPCITNIILPPEEQ